ncbi:MULTISPECIES: benzoate/H(+) symporter BenE family transporter [Vitreoscilla]|uniref:Benzoate/H(+) symporter BenE family transporter n=1 Tax=Vitreoscilla stercoraria TaxID=61 RepID=A0ABY4EDF2_VITST|nr:MULTISPECIES: benzoate/H(+) symporter BenE family transporter [Vitreoscilla]QJQ52291.1 benzoate transporter [Vitreoscilla sp. C1]UOO93321.1 benzoate/H(+) symporter BenE family transporter [Vitreoscilla stercoraria]
MKHWFNVSHIAAGFSTVLVGYTSSIIIVIQAATAAGATPVQIESWLLTLGILMGVSCIGFSWYYKKPILTAWSTPGAAMLVVSAAQYDLSVVLGVCMFTGILIALTGLITPLSRALSSIPPFLGTAMLGAILLPFCLKAFLPLGDTPVVFLGMFVSYLLAKHFLPRYTMLILLMVGVVFALFQDAFVGQNITLSMAQPVWITPQWDVMAIINLSLPLYVLTMLSQNLPGIAMMKSYGYETPVKPVLFGTGLMNVVAAPMGGFSINLAAISAAMCLNENVDANPKQRYRAAMWAGVFYLIAGVWASTVVALFLALPQNISQILAGLALLGTLMMCLQNSFKDTGHQDAALLTFLITLSGVSVLGINAILWGLLVGCVYLQLTRNKS